jgi:hypothetical protein
MYLFRKTYKYKSFKTPFLTSFVKANLLTDNKNMVSTRQVRMRLFLVQGDSSFTARTIKKLVKITKL